MPALIAFASLPCWYCELNWFKPWLLRWVVRLLDRGVAAVSLCEELSPGDLNSSVELTVFCERGLVGYGCDPKADLAVISAFGGWCPGPLFIFMFYFKQLFSLRDDGKDSLKLYTDPDYFFTFWRDGLILENKIRKSDREKKKVGSQISKLKIYYNQCCKWN